MNNYFNKSEIRKTKKKILLVHYSLIGKDRWGRIFPLARALAKHNFDVVLLTSTSNSKRWSFNDIAYIDNVKVISYCDIVPTILLSKGIGLVSFLLRLFYAFTHKFDYVYSDCGEFPNSGWPCKINQWLYKAVYISESGDLIGRGGFYDNKSTYFKFFLGWFYLWAIKYFRQSADVVVVLSERMKSYMISRGISESKIVVVPGGASCDLIPYVGTSKSKTTSDKYVFGYIGIDDLELLDLIPFINVINESNYRGKFKLVATGKKLSESLIRNYNLQEILEEYGWIDFYNDFSKWGCVDAFLLMKKRTNLESSAWPNKLGDYLSIGRPVLVTPYGDIEKFVYENPAGFIPLTLDRSSIIETLDNILLGKYDFEQMGRINRKIAEDKISWDTRASTLIDFLDTATETN